MDVLLAQLPDRATIPGGTLHCARVGVERRNIGTVVTDSGAKVNFSEELICRIASAPAVGAAVTVGSVTGVVSARRIVDTRGPWQRHARIFITQRSDITGALPDTITAYPSETATDAYGTARRVPSMAGITMPARVGPASSTENHQDGQRRTQDWTLTTDGDLLAQGVDAYATIHHGVTVYQLTGDPLVRLDATGGRWSTATMRRTGPGTA